ncbi:MAG: hypothetical protein HGA85_07610, partial [Nanoarchaeota archaeon]|nr:hypothetical protein [Nanoarchaeota archaeon]
EKITEENYFFKLSKYEDKLIKHIEENPGFIIPETRRNEVLGLLKGRLGNSFEPAYTRFVDSGCPDDINRLEDTPYQEGRITIENTIAGVYNRAFTWDLIGGLPKGITALGAASHHVPDHSGKHGDLLILLSAHIGSLPEDGALKYSYVERPGMSHIGRACGAGVACLGSLVDLGRVENPLDSSGMFSVRPEDLIMDSAYMVFKLAVQTYDPNRLQSILSETGNPQQVSFVRYLQDMSRNYGMKMVDAIHAKEKLNIAVIDGITVHVGKMDYLVLDKIKVYKH